MKMVSAAGKEKRPKKLFYCRAKAAILTKAGAESRNWF
jgi:hypothetical protein